MKRLVLSLAAWWVALNALWAVQAEPGLKTLTCSDGRTVTIQLHGDERFHYTTDASGYLVRQDSRGRYVYASLTEDGRWVLSGDEIGSPSAVKSRRVPPSARLNALARYQARNSARPEAVVTKAPARPKTSEVESPRTLVLVLEFADRYLSPGHGREDFERLLNEKGYADNEATGSVADYYEANSMGRFRPQFTVAGPYRLSNEMAWYGGNNENGDDLRPYEMVMEGLRMAAEEISLAEFDPDGDGFIDNIFVFYAGYAESSGGGDDCIWPHSCDLYDRSDNEAGGVRLLNYACASELVGTSGYQLSAIGTCCHEYGHSLGLMDSYDTDGKERQGNSKGLGSLSLMGSGNYNNQSRTPPYLNAEERRMLGWLEPEPLPLGEQRLRSVAHNTAYRIDTQNPDEYFLLEYRCREGWDMALPVARGLLVYHIDRSANWVIDRTARACWASNIANACPHHKCFYALPTATADKEANWFIPGSNQVTALGPRTTPRLADWSGGALPVALSNIALADSVVNFLVSSNRELSLSGTVSDREGCPIEGVSLNLESLDAGSVSRVGRWTARAAAQAYTCQSDAYGNWSIPDIAAPGRYRLTASLEGYVEVTQDLTLNEGPQRCDLRLLKTDERLYETTLAHYGDISGIALGGFGEDAVVQVAWTPAELQSCEGLSAGVVLFHLSEIEGGAVEVSIENGPDERFRRLESSQLQMGWNRVDFRLEPLTIHSDEPLRITLRYTDFPEWSYPMSVDGGPGVEGGNLLFENGAWLTLSEVSQGSMDYNWLIGLDVYRCDTGSVIRLERLEATQYCAWARWEDSRPAKWQLCALSSEGETVDSVWTETPQAVLTQLQPDTLYRLRLTAYTMDGDYLDSVEQDFRTEAPAGKFPLLVWRSGNDGSCLLDVHQRPAGARSVRFYLDGVKQDSPLLNLPKGTHLLEAEMDLGEAGVEHIRKQVTL